MDFYYHFVFRTFRDSDIVSCRVTQTAVRLVVSQMIWEDTDESLKSSGQVTEDECLLVAGEIVDLVCEKIYDRRERVEDRLTRDAAARNRIDPSFRYEKYRIERRRTWGQRRISFA